MMLKGGKTVYGASVGILMLETQFPRMPGDIGHAGTWSFPVHYRVVRGATPSLVVRNRAEGLLDAFIEAGKDLVAMGADGITTNCGFLSLFQRDLADALNVPVATSSLMQVRQINSMLPHGQRVGVLTISAASLDPDHLAAADAPLDTPIVGTDQGREFSRAILADEYELDRDKCRLDLLDAADTLITSHRDIGAIVLECTNMVPFSADIRAQSGLPVFSIGTFLEWFQNGLLPKRYSAELDDFRKLGDLNGRPK